MAQFANYLQLMRPRRRARWSIGIYAGPSPLQLAPHPAIGSAPVLTTRSLGGIKASGVADPFMMRHGQGWLMFFEIENLRSGRGEIGLAASPDAMSWHFEGVVLKEPFHLSYPCVWECGGDFYMLPESSGAGALRLYKAKSFPFDWTFDTELMRGRISDATPFHHDGRWWIFALHGFRDSDLMNIYYAEHPQGPWRAHSGNPVLRGNRSKSRPAGRFVRHESSLLRFAQDYEGTYGRAVHAFEIDQLAPDAFVEHPVGESELLGPSGAGWNATGMHHVDAHQRGPGDWIACVDGRATETYLPALDAIRSRMHRVAKDRES
jgi:hypothetical protein